MNEEDRAPLGWWQGREARRAARAERRRERHDARQELRAPKEAARAPMTPDRLADAALRVIDSEGLEALTIRRLAQELGVGTMTLYWYVSNKEEVLDLVADHILGLIPLPAAEGDWRLAAREVAVAVRATFLAHRNAFPIVSTRASIGPSALRLIDSAIGLFRAAGFDPGEAADAHFTLSNFVTGFVGFETAALTRANAAPLDQLGFGQLVRQYLESLPKDRYANLREAGARILSGSAEERFAFGLDCVIEGLAAKLASDAAPR